MRASIAYFMTEVRTDNWQRSVAWYRETLGSRVVFEDPVGRFALLEVAGGGRVAIKEKAVARGERGAVRLVFEVEDVDIWQKDLIARRVDFEGPITSAEGYRELTLVDPDGTPIGLFAWSRLDSEPVQ